MALQTGIVDAVEQPNASCYNNSWYEQLDYINITNHIFCDIDLFMNEAKFQSLDAEAQEVILTAAQEAGDKLFDQIIEADQDYIDKLQEGGLELNDDLDTSPIVDIMKEQVWPSYFDTVSDGREFVDTILAMNK